MVSNVVFHLFSSVINRNVLRWHSSRQVSTVFRGVASNVEVFCMTTSNNRGGEDISVLWWWYTFLDRCGQIKEIFSSALPLSGVSLRSTCWESFALSTFLFSFRHFDCPCDYHFSHFLWSVRFHCSCHYNCHHCVCQLDKASKGNSFNWCYWCVFECVYAVQFLK